MFVAQLFCAVLISGLMGSGDITSLTKQAKNITKHIDAAERTKYSYEDELRRFAIWCGKNFKITRFDKIDSSMAHQYLYERAEYVQQSTLNQERQAMSVLTNRPKSKMYSIKIEYINSQLETNLTCRTYTREQIDLVKLHQNIKNALATEIAFVAGLRAHELITIRKIEEQPIDNRPWSVHKYLGRESYVQYSVKGKGGLIREVRLPPSLAAQLESFRRPRAIKVTDRKIYYMSQYDIGYGNNWSSSFSGASKRALDWSNGGHGTRHSYAQKRVSELQHKGLTFEESLSAVSSELGHLRSEITKVYLR